MALRSAGDGAGAVAEFHELQRRAPDYVPTYLMLGQLLDELGRPAEALETLELGMAAAQRRGDAHAEREIGDRAEGIRTRGKTP